MKKKECEKFARQYLIPQMPGFEVKGNLIYQVPVGVVFRGYVFDSSSFEKTAFNPDVFVQPLYVPSEHLTMTLGRRLPGVWKLRSPNDKVLADKFLQIMAEQGQLLLERLGTPEKIARNAEKTDGGSRNHYVRQAVAYSLIWIGENGEAIRKLDELLVMLKEMGSGIQKWALEVHEEVSLLRAILVKEPSEAKALLAQWAEQTRQTLNLPT
jgi:hypothetical protein